MCVYTTYTEHSWSSLCKLLNKSGLRMNTQSKHQHSAVCFCFYLPSASHGNYDNKMTDLPEWQKYLHPANSNLFQGERQSGSFCCHFRTFSIIYRNIWFCESFLSLPFWLAAMPILIQWKRKTNTNISFPFFTWRNRRIHVIYLSHCNDSYKGDMHIEVWMFVRVHVQPIEIFR